jgi:hypothetical protein
VLFAKSRYTEARTNAAANNAAILPGGVIQGPSEVSERVNGTLVGTAVLHEHRLEKLGIESFLVKTMGQDNGSG